MEIQVSYRDQEFIIHCPNDQVYGQFIFDQISNMIKQHQDTFELQLHTELGQKNLLKNQTLSSQHITQQSQNYLVVQPKFENKSMSDSANFLQGNNFNIPNQQFPGMLPPTINNAGQHQFQVNKQYGSNQQAMIQEQMTGQAQIQNQFPNQNQEQNNNYLQGPQPQVLPIGMQVQGFAQNQIPGLTNSINNSGTQFPMTSFQIAGPTQFPAQQFQMSSQNLQPPFPIHNQPQLPPFPLNNSAQLPPFSLNNSAQLPGQPFPLNNQTQLPGQPFPLNNQTQLPGQPFPLSNQTQLPGQPFPINNQPPQILPINNQPPQILPTILPKSQENKLIEKLKQQLEDKDEEIQKLRELNKKSENQIKKLNQENIKLKNEHEEEKEKLNSDYKEEQNRREQIILYQNQQNQTKIKSLNSEIEDLKEECESLQNDFKRYKQQVSRQTGTLNDKLLQSVQNEQNIIEDLRAKNQQLNKQGRDRDQKVQNQEYEIEQLKRQLEQRNDKMEIEQQNKNEEIEKRFQEQSQQLKLLQNQVNELGHQAYVEQKKREDREKEIGKLKEKVYNLENQIELQTIEINNDKKIIQYIQEETNKNMDGNNRIQLMPQFNQELQRLQQNMQREIAAKKKMEEEKKENELQKQKELNAVKMMVQEERQQQVKLERQKKACKLREAIMNTQGILQVGLLVDVTGSMDAYKDATMNIIQRTMGCIKSQTNRDCEWGAVCYQDFAELKQRGEYMQYSFTRNSNQMIDFLKNIICDGGDDGAEDLRNGIKQLITNLKWEKYFKIALLICDAPSHGKKWTGNVLDYYPDEDLEDALQLLINKNIVLIGIEFSQNTDIMFAQMKNFYAKQNKQQLLIIVDLKNRKPDQIQEQLINIISEASISITEVNQQGTKTKKENLKREGAFEALVKLLPDPTKFNLDPKIATIQTNFKVFRVEINQKAFENNITQIYKIKVPQDYTTVLESEWNCIRTLKPFAFGQLKEVYLMKKQNNASQDEVYVIKMPIGGQTYKTMNEALLECRSHLISKRLMQRFMQDLNDKGFNNIQIKYSDFLILQEHDTSFWIAERFFKGEFVKFNNNFGYVNPSQDLLNNIAQVFSYYTYHISDFQYMICDVQGVGNNFTDPAINTSEGSFDETDLGQDGIGQYIISFEKDKQIRYQKYLDMLELKD